MLGRQIKHPQSQISREKRHQKSIWSQFLLSHRILRIPSFSRSERSSWISIRPKQRAKCHHRGLFLDKTRAESPEINTLDVYPLDVFKKQSWTSSCNTRHQQNKMKNCQWFLNLLLLLFCLLSLVNTPNKFHSDRSLVFLWSATELQFTGLQFKCLVLA